MHIFKNPNYDFVRWKWHAIILSWIVIAAGGLMIATRGMPKGVEFSGGTIVIVKFAKTTNVDAVRTALPGGANAIVQQYGDPSTNQVMVRIHSAGEEAGAELSSRADEV